MSQTPKAAAAAAAASQGTDVKEKGTPGPVPLPITKPTKAGEPSVGSFKVSLLLIF